MDKEIEELNLYTEIETGRVFEGKLFDEFVIVRGLSTGGRSMRKVDVVEFSKTFDDYQGDREDVRSFLRGETVPMEAFGWTTLN